MTIDPSEHASIIERGAESPMFVFPLRREGGHFMLLSQFTAAHRMFVLTSLEEYRRSPTLAQPWASLHVFDELLSTKAVALLRAEVVPERLTTEEASHLLLLLRRYYGTANYDKVSRPVSTTRRGADPSVMRGESSHAETFPHVRRAPHCFPGLDVQSRREAL